MNTTTRWMFAAATGLLVAVPLVAAAEGPGIKLSSTTAAPGKDVEVTAALVGAGGKVAGTQNDFSVKPPTVTVKRKPNGKPDCTVNPQINKTASTFVFRPPGCSGDACTTVRVLVFSTEDVASIPDGSTLYTCKLQVAANATPGTVPLDLGGTILSDPTGVRVCGNAANDPPCKGNVNGAVTIEKGGKSPAKGKKGK